MINEQQHETTLRFPRLAAAGNARSTVRVRAHCPMPEGSSPSPGGWSKGKEAKDGR
jgi:hypothetical protein